MQEKGKKINFIYQARKSNCDKLFFLGRFSIDFYLLDYDIAIECQGIQHFKCDKSKKSFYSEKVIGEVIERDIKKRKLCEENGIKVIYYSKLGIDYPYEVFEDKDKLLNEIKKYGKKLD